MLRDLAFFAFLRLNRIAALACPQVVMKDFNLLGALAAFTTQNSGAIQPCQFPIARDYCFHSLAACWLPEVEGMRRAVWEV